jgi:Ser/Thr protein kinase RdoA (MazF antagonist)
MDEVRALLARFPEASEPVAIASISPRPFSAASLVTTRGKDVFIKRHHRSVRDAAGLLEEHGFVEHLHAYGAAVPRLLATASGVTAIEIGEWTYEVHDTAEGMDLYEDALSWTPFRSAEHAYSVGMALAKLHDASGGFVAPPRKPRPLVASFTIFAAQNPSDAMERYLLARPALRSDEVTRRNCTNALELLADFHAELLPLLPSLRPLWTHNDFHASNLFWSDSSSLAEARTIIDFGLCDRTNAVHDLAHAIERNIVEWLALVNDPIHPEDVPVHLESMEALLDGYESMRPLSNEEAAALAPMTALCHAEFALSEADYFLGVLHSDGKARLASDDYLVGHARWFRDSSGRKLLEVLRARTVERERRVAY